MIDDKYDVIVSRELNVSLNTNSENREENWLIVGTFLLRHGKYQPFPRKYITFPERRYISLKRMMICITSALDDVILCKDVKFVEHLGRNMCVGVASPYQCVSIRQWFRLGGDINKELLPGYGVFLDKDECSTPVESDSVMNDFITSLEDTEICIDMHHRQLFIVYLECNPDKLHYDCL